MSNKIREWEGEMSVAGVLSLLRDTTAKGAQESYRKKSTDTLLRMLRAGGLPVFLRRIAHEELATRGVEVDVKPTPREAASGNDGRQAVSRALAQPEGEVERERWFAAMPAYLRRHWRGEFPLLESFWGNYFLITLIINGLLTALASAISAIQPGAVSLAAGLSLAYLVARVPLWAWQIVGVWRSARHHVLQTRKRLWARLSQGVMIFSAASIVLVWPSLTIHVTKQVFGLQAHDDYRVSLLGNGTELSVSGGIGRGLAKEVERYLVRHPDVGVIHLDSPGGDVHEARRLRDVIVDRQLVSYVRFRCHSACALAFTGGRERVLHTDAVLGFHRATLPDFGRYANWVFGEAMQEGEREVEDLTRRILQAAGVSQMFIRRVLGAYSPNTWFPDQEELLQAGVITAVTDGSEFYPPELVSGVESRRDDAMDERRRAVEQDPGDADAWRDLGDAALDGGELDEAEASYTRFIALVQEASDMQALASGYRRLGHVYGRLDRIEQAEAMYRKSMDMATESGDVELTGKAYLSLGWVYRSREDFAQAEQMYEKSLAVAKEAGDKGLMGVAYAELGAVQQGRDDQRQAEAMYRKALSLVTEVDDKEAVAGAYARLARFYGDQGDSTRAEEMYGNTLALAKEIGDRALVGEAYASLAWIHLRRNDVQHAESMGHRALAVYKALESKGGVGQTYFLLGLVYASLGDSAMGEVLLSKSAGLLREAGDDDGVQRVQDVLNRLKDKDQV